MQNSYPDFGERRSVHRPSLSWILWLVLCVAPILLVTTVAAVYAVSSFTSGPPEGKGRTFGNVAGPFGCLGGLGLLLALVGAACISDFRKWYATRTARLIIYQKGFTYESQGHMESCHWSDIKHIDFTRIEIRIKYTTPRKVNVVRSIVKNDGTVISLADTLDLQKITKLISMARGKAS